MARATKMKPLTGRQQEIVDLAKSGMSAGDIAQVLQASPGSIYQQVSRLRAAGHLPKSARNGGSRSNGRTSTKARRNVSEQAGREYTEPSVNGSPDPQTLEQHLASDLQATTDRIVQIQTEQEKLGTELAGLTTRSEKLTAAQQALTAS